MADYRSKIQPLNKAISIAEEWRKDGEKIAFTNGCFDILHIGHVDYIEKARQKGDKLILGLNTDISVNRIKGSERPIINEKSRSAVIASLESVDLVVLFDEDTPELLIRELKPDILVKGNDYLAENIVGSDFVIANGGTVETIPLVEGYSTSSIIEKIKKEQ